MTPARRAPNELVVVGMLSLLASSGQCFTPATRSSARGCITRLSTSRARARARAQGLAAAATASGPHGNDGPRGDELDLELLDDPFAKVRLEHTSTIALVPPEHVWPRLQAARRQLRDKGLYRWPPHLNLLYPFLPPQHYREGVAALAPTLAEIEPFSITLDRLAIFGGRRRGVLWCGPSDPEELAALRHLQVRCCG